MSVAEEMSGDGNSAPLHSNPAISEVFSPPRITVVAHKFGLQPGDALDQDGMGF